MNSRELPVYALERELIAAASEGGKRIVLQAPTGSGKSTQVPQMLCDHGLVARGQRVVILQPRRLAARMLAARVARERGVSLGSEVGYQIRFEDHSSAATRIHYVTEGILLRQMTANPELPGIGTVIFDEFHERHLYGDITLARAVELQAGRRPDLNVIVMSATLDSGALVKYLAPCAALQAEGRLFPVDFQYLANPPNPERTPVWELASAETGRHCAA